MLVPPPIVQKPHSNGHPLSVSICGIKSYLFKISSYKPKAYGESNSSRFFSNFPGPPKINWFSYTNELPGTVTFSLIILSLEQS